MTSKWLTIFAVVLIAVGAFLFREPKLTLRVFHQDEAIHCYRLQEIRVEGVYKYIPSEYHGPTLNYFTFPVLWLTGANDWLKATEWHYRMVTVLFGAALVLSVLLLRDALGNVATVFAALLTAVSPAMVFYSRYYIQEMLLVFFTAIAIGAGWRFSRSQRWGWLVILGACIGFMHATKETFIINLFAAAVALGCACLLTRGASLLPVLRPRPWLVAIVAAIVVSVALFSSFFQYWRGVLDSVLAYGVYFSRGKGENTDHVHEWWYYFQILFWHKIGPGPLHTELAIPVLSLLGFVHAFWPRRRPAEQRQAIVGRLVLLRWLAIYTLVLTIVYCRISYKTPWCALGFLHGMILLAGVGASAIIRFGGWLAAGCPSLVARASSPCTAAPRSMDESRSPACERAQAPVPMPATPCHVFRTGAVITQLILAVILLLPLLFMPYKGQRYDLARQAYDLSFNPRMVADSRFNPHVYGHTSTKLLELIERVNEIARVWPSREKISIQVTTDDYWPAPWYLRQFMNARFPGTRPFVSPELVITNAKKNEMPLPAGLEENYRADYFGLRPHELLVLHVRNDVWAKFIESRAKGPTQARSAR